MEETTRNTARVIIGHKNAAQHHQEAAKAHLEAVRYHEEGDEENANKSAIEAHGHSEKAKSYDAEVAQHHGL